MPSYLVTGAAKGLGLEFVNQLSADSGNIVFAIVRNKATATQIADLRRTNVIILEADVDDAKALQLAANDAAKVTGGQLDYLISNAGRSSHSGFTLSGYPTPEALEHDVLDIFKTNTLGAIHTINAFLPLLKKGSGKKVLVVSSALGDIESTVSWEFLGAVSYSISKAALNMAVAKYAAEYKPQGFVFVAVHPGIVNTGMSPRFARELEMIMAANKKANPNWQGPIPIEESISKQLNILHKWRIEETGAFVSYNGDKVWVP
ncbi:NAD(P)-binding protein [Favolaschia claudopus]|uniref:NAD(P)-binding protein n=1 Tax=Favolaschia claudopus TaxID=2862362 RepID=A0AAW0DVI9_9AGAR